MRAAHIFVGQADRVGGAPPRAACPALSQGASEVMYGPVPFHLLSGATWRQIEQLIVGGEPAINLAHTTGDANENSTLKILQPHAEKWRCWVAAWLEIRASSSECCTWDWLCNYSDFLSQ